MKDDLIPYKDIVNMVENLGSDKISLIVNKDLGHCTYSEIRDIVLPTFDFYKKKYMLENVMEEDKVVNKANLLNANLETISIIRI